MSRRRFFNFAAAAFALLAVTCGIREDELRCEEAVAKLVECCSGFVATEIGCYYTGCGTSPAITIEESRCISSQTCAVIVSSGVCARAQLAKPNDEFPTDSSYRQVVCP